MKRVAIIGSRNFSDQQQVVDYVNSLPTDIVVVSGGARGVDTWAVEAAEKRGLATMVFKPMYDLYGRTAPLERNKHIVLCSDEIVAFWDGTSRGTYHATSYARKIGKPVTILYPTKDE